LEWFEVHHAEAAVAFEELVVRHGAMVLDVCRRVLHNPHDVEDAFQATFLVLARRAGSVRNRDALGGWLHRVALRVALRAKSEAAHRREVEQSVVAAANFVITARDIERADFRSVLHEELDRIPASYRAALVACYLEGLTHEEAAKRLGWPVGTVRSRLARGRDQLRDRLTRRGLAPGIALPMLASPPDLVPACLQKLTAQSMLSYVAGQFLVEKVSAPVATLAEGVIRAMKLRMLRILVSVALTVGAVAGMLPLLIMQAPRQVKASAAQAQRAEPDPAKSLAGVVRDSQGHPVAGATVVAGAFTTEPNHLMAATGRDGRFVFQSKEGEQELRYVLAYKEGLAPASKFGSGFDERAPNGDVELVLLKAEPFVGTVRDRNERPVAGARVRIKYMRGKRGKYDHNPILDNVLQGTPLDTLFHATTDKQGAFHFPAVPAPQRVVLHVSADGMADMSTEMPGDYEAGYISGTAARPAQLKMECEARVAGRVVTKLPGVSAARLKVGLQSTNDSTQFWRDTRTDDEGRFEMRGLPEGGGNIFPMDHPSDGPWTYRAIDNLALHPGKTAEVTIELIEGCLVEGEVLDAVSGDPIAGVSVGMYGPARPRSGAAIITAKTDDKGRYRFRLPPGQTQLYISSPGQWPPPAQHVVVPDHAKILAVPTLQVQKAKAAAAPAPRPAEVSKPVSLTTVGENEAFAFAGVVRDVSDQPIGGVTVVAAMLKQGLMSDRQIVTSGADGRFALKLASPKTTNALARIFAFKEGLAPAGASVRASDSKTAGEVKLVLARTRPFIGIVQDQDEKPIAGADVRVQSINAPVPEGQGMMVTELVWQAIEGTPLEGALRATSDEEGVFRLPSMPARSQVKLIVTAKGMRTHRTADLALRHWTGRSPAGFDGEFLHGSADTPARLYLDPETKAKTVQQGRTEEDDAPDHDALTKTGDVAPDFEVTTLENKRVRLFDLKGKVVLINFFATWCGPCLAELPRLQSELWKPNEKRGLIVLAIGREHTMEELTEFLHEHHFSFSIGPDPHRTIFKQYAAQSIPRNYVIGPDGRIAYQSMGYSPPRFQKLIEAVEKELDALTKKVDR